MSHRFVASRCSIAPAAVPSAALSSAALSSAALSSAALSIAALSIVTLAACSNPQLIETPKAKPAAEAPAAPSGPDAYRDHAGPHIAAGEVFRLKDTAYAVDGAQVVVSLVKAAWSKRELPDGRTVREGSAEIQVARGEESTRRILEQGEAKTMLGVRVSVVNAGEDYDEKRLDYIPWVELKVEAAE